jgi:hypothetical protein
MVPDHQPGEQPESLAEFRPTRRWIVDDPDFEALDRGRPEPAIA